MTKRVWKQEDIKALPTRELISIARSTSATGAYASQLGWALQELNRRGVTKFSDYDEEAA